MSSTRRSKRKCESVFGSPDGRPRIEVRNTLQELKWIGPIHTLPNHSTTSRLLELCFLRMNAHIWYRILPVDASKCDDISFATGQPWELLRPLLIHLGYLTQIGIQEKVNLHKFTDLQHLNLGKNKLIMSSTHFKNDTKNYYLCIGKPHFTGPNKQIKAKSNGAFASASMRYINASDTLLRVRLQEHMDAVSNHMFRNENSRDKYRINTLATTILPSAPPEAPIQTSPQSNTKITNSIDEALSLDLRLYPRPNRHDANKFISIKKTSISSQCTKLVILITAENGD